MRCGNGIDMCNHLDLLNERIGKIEVAFSAMNAPVICGCGAGRGNCRGAHDASRLRLRSRPASKADGAAVEREPADLNLAETMIAARQLRLKYLDQDMFFDPTWSMLLDLYKSELKKERLSVSSLCLGSGVPETTALRYLRLLEVRGYIERLPDLNDKRRVHVVLSRAAFAKLAGYFENLRSHFLAE